MISAWLTGLCSTPGAPVSVKVTATDITTTQFTLVIDSSGGERLISVGAAWAVWHPDDDVLAGWIHDVEREVNQFKLTAGVFTMPLVAASEVDVVFEQGVLLELLFAPSMQVSQARYWEFTSDFDDMKELSVNSVPVLEGL